MNVNRRLESLPELDIGLPERHEILLLAAVLIVGLTFVTPALSLALGVPALVFVVVVGAFYGVLAVLLRRLLAGSLVGLLVTSTFMANIPLTSTAHLASFPAHLGPSLWLAQIPLVASIALILLTEPRKVLAGATKVDGLFAAFVGWTVISALFGATARVDTALYFSLLMAQGLAVFVLFRYAVQRELLSFGLVARVFVGIVLAQCLFAVGQFFNKGLFGVTTLGEYTRTPIASISLGPLGEFSAGTYVAGFTGMSFTLASLIVLAVPIVLALALRASSWRRWTFVGVAVIMTAVLRTTGTDAGRGAFAVAVGTFAVALVVFHRRGLLSNPGFSGGVIRRVVPAIFAALVGITAFLYPSSASGSSSTVTNIGSSGGAGANAGTGGGGAGANAGDGSGVTEATLQELSIPFFDIGGLGIRLQQYFIGLDLFVQHPLFGIGGANFIYYAMEYGLPRSIPLHSIYIVLLAETGLPGFLLYIAVLALVLWTGWRTIVITTDTGDRLLLVGILAGFVGFLAFGFFDHLPLTKLPPVMLFWILTGAMIGRCT